MDPRFLKWLSEMLSLWAENLSAMEKLAAGRDAPDWFKLMQHFSGAASPPFSPELMQRFYGEWLAFFGAVPRKDYEEMEKKVAELAAEVDRLRSLISNMSRSMAAAASSQEVLKPWMELAQQAMKVNLRWLNEPPASSESQRRGEGNDPAGEEGGEPPQTPEKEAEEKEFPAGTKGEEE